MKRKRALLAALGVLVVAGGALAAFVVRRGPDPCAEPEDLPVPRERVVRCAERYVQDQWYTDRWGRFGALDGDVHGNGSWLELMRKHRGTLQRELSALCTHPKDRKGALGHVALFEPTDGRSECRVVSVTPLLGVSLRDETCASVREHSACISRTEAQHEP